VEATAFSMSSQREAGRQMRRPARITVSIKDWNGDAVITIVAGVALLVCLFLPWANERRHGMNWALTKPDDISGAIHTPWGIPMLACSLAVIACGILMLRLGPRRLAFLLGIVVFCAGLYAGKLATDGAWHAMGWGYSGGIGVAGSMLVAALLLPIGFAAAAVGFMVAYWAPNQPLQAEAPVTSPEAVSPMGPPSS
jgi:hypothetical protein